MNEYKHAYDRYNRVIYQDDIVLIYQKYVKRKNLFIGKVLLPRTLEETFGKENIIKLNESCVDARGAPLSVGDIVFVTHKAWWDDREIQSLIKIVLEITYPSLIKIDRNTVVFAQNCIKLF